VNKLIEAIEDEKYEFICGEGVMESAHNYALDKAIDLINTHIEGKVLVPVEPTDEMLSELCNGWESMAGNYMSENYKAMLSTIGEGQ